MSLGQRPQTRVYTAFDLDLISLSISRYVPPKKGLKKEAPCVKLESPQNKPNERSPLSMTNLTATAAKNQPAKSDNIYDTTSIIDPSTLNYAEFCKFLEDINPDKISGQPSPKPSKRKSVKVREPIDLPPWTEVQLSRQGNYGEVIYMAAGSHGATIRKLDADRYQVIKTGEIRYFGEHSTKIKDNLTKTFRDLVGVLRLNFAANQDNQVFMTLTYADNMTDPDKLYKDFDVFFKRLKYSLKDHKLEYVAVAEPQQRGAWHLHVFIKSNQPVLYIDNKLITSYITDPDTGKRVLDPKRSMWPWGASSTERLKGDDTGQYYIAYFTNIILDAKDGSEHVLVKQDGQRGLKQSKRIRKGARIAMYPKHFKLYRCSRGIMRPTTETTKYEYVKEDYPVKTKSNAIDILEGDKIINTIQRESYKRNAPASKLPVPGADGGAK